MLVALCSACGASRRGAADKQTTHTRRECHPFHLNCEVPFHHQVSFVVDQHALQQRLLRTHRYARPARVASYHVASPVLDCGSFVYVLTRLCVYVCLKIALPYRQISCSSGNQEMRLPNEQKPAAAASDFARGSSLFRSLRSRLSDAVSGAAPQPARASAGPAVPEREGPVGGGGGGSAMDANGDAVGRQGTIEVQPVMIRKTPKFPSRERHLAIRRKNRVPPAEMVELAASCPGSPLSVTSGRRLSKKTCQECKCPRETHAVYHEQLTTVRERLGFKHDTNTSRVDPRQMGYTWVPPGILTSAKIQRYFDVIPPEKVPKIGTQGERFRDKQLVYQLPKQDLALDYCKHVEEQHRGSYEDFVAARNEIALDIGYVKDTPLATKCTGCSDTLNQGEMAVTAPKFREQTLWHPRCFKCTTCDELLVDLTYCVHDDQIYCERHYAEMLKPRCSACDELIFSGEYTKAMSKDWHSGHFCCWQCDESLTGQRYVLRDEHPYCIKCYENVFANVCEECNKTIGIDSKDLSYKDKHWHEACFLCNKCRISLVDKQFGSKADKIYCGNCYDAQFASRCDGCGEIFRAGTKKMEYKTRQWHEKCFCCCVCKTAIGTKSFIPREQEIYCAGCYEEKYATRCIKCKKIITSGGVTYKNEPWHRECFTCTHCQVSLAGQRFTSRDEKPYCAECFGELFAKRCTSCTKPITGIGGTRFISFEDRHWHNDCFICAMCKTSLVGRGFITDEQDVICPECAKQKLM